MKLYYSPGACSLSPHIVAREAGIALDLVKVDLKARKLEDGGDYARINAKGYVPTLALDDGTLLTEGPAIVQYLADRAPASGLAPANGTIERYRLQEWLNFLTSEVHKSFSPLFNPQAAEGWKEAARANIARRFDFLAERLGPSAYLMGERFTVADAYLFVLLNWCPWTGVDLGRWPALQAYHARVAARPKVQEALRAEGLAK
ncbi:MAG: glutathione transferase GstA [Burkholderiales bacterium]|mgnify:CR=1 FL=1